MIMIDRIKDLCDERSINITNLCFLITGSTGNLSTWKKGNIRNDYLIKIANYFNVSTDYLLGITDIKSPLDEQLENEEFALYGETKDLTDEEKEKVLEFIKFTKSQRKK